MSIGGTLKRFLFPGGRSNGGYVCDFCEATFDTRRGNCVACGSTEIREQ